jgi:transposase-like protein
MDTNKIEEYFNMNLSLREIERLTGVNRKKISSYLKNKGFSVKSPIPNNSPEKEAIYLEAEKAYLDGEGIKSISKRMNFSPVYFSRWLEQRGRKKPRKLNKEKQIKLNTAVQLVQEGIARTKVARIVKINDNELVNHLKNEGVEVKNGIYNHNISVFEQIDTEEKAYWLGFIYADGYVTNSDRFALEISLKKSDKNHLAKFRSFLMSDAKISDKTIYLRGKEYQASRIIIHSKKIVEDLISKGCVPRKSLILTFPTADILPHTLVRHFIRGYFDGDGSIQVIYKSANIEVLGTKTFLSEIANKYDIPLELRGHGQTWGLHFGKKIYTIRFILDIYTNQSIALDRKEMSAMKFLKLNEEHLKSIDGTPNEGKLSCSV